MAALGWVAVAIAVVGAGSAAHAQSRRDSTESQLRALDAAVTFRNLATQHTPFVGPVVRPAQQKGGFRDATWTRGDLSTWKLFFDGSHLYIGAITTQEPLLAWYNPFSDVAFLGIWKFTDAGKPPVVTDACLIPGESLRNPGYAVSRDPVWRVAKRPVTELRANSLAVRNSLGTRFPKGEPIDSEKLREICSPDAAKIANYRAYIMTASVGSLAANGATRPLQSLVDRAAKNVRNLASGLSLPATDALALNTVGGSFATFAPVAAVTHVDERQVMFMLASPGKEQTYYLVRLLRDDNDQWTVRGFSAWRL